MKEESGRLYQDNAFVVQELNGLKIEQIVVCQEINKEEPIIVYLKVEGKNWHQFFLDAGIGFWESWETFEKDEDYTYLDLTDKFALRGNKILAIYCCSDCHNSRIVLKIEGEKKLILKCIDPTIFDSSCELILK